MSAGDNAKASGALGEEAVLKVFGLREPEVEVKTMMKQKVALIEVSQLERFTGKTYIFVTYNRGPRHRRGSKRHFGTSIQDAFREPLRFTFMTSEELVDMGRNGEMKLRYVKHAHESGGRFYFEFNVRNHTKDKPFQTHQGHVVHFGESYVSEVNAVQF